MLNKTLTVAVDLQHFAVFVEKGLSFIVAVSIPAQDLQKCNIKKTV